MGAAVRRRYKVWAAARGPRRLRAGRDVPDNAARPCALSAGARAAAPIALTSSVTLELVNKKIIMRSQGLYS